MPQTVSGGCHCGNIRIAIELTHASETYRPRACDCDFCRKHAAAYVSDAQGSLLVRIKDERHSRKYRQGSELADFLLCARCGVLVGVFYQGDARLYAAVNAKAVDPGANFGAEQTVSPQKLASGEKLTRWQDVWFANVRVVSGDV